MISFVLVVDGLCVAVASVVFFTASSVVVVLEGFLLSVVLVLIIGLCVVFNNSGKGVKGSNAKTEEYLKAESLSVKKL